MPKQMKPPTFNSLYDIANEIDSPYRQLNGVDELLFWEAPCDIVVGVDEPVFLIVTQRFASIELVVHLQYQAE